MVGENDLDLEIAGLLGEILRRHPGPDERTLSDLIGERTGEIAEHPDLDCPVRNFGEGL